MTKILTAGDAIYWSVLEDPFDLSLRLIWADWLEDQGDSDGAELTRLMVELETIECDLEQHWKTCPCCHKKRRVEALQKGGNHRWFQSSERTTLEGIVSEGYAAQMFSHQPLTSITLVDRNCMYSHDRDPDIHEEPGWFCQDGGTEPDDLPETIWCFLDRVRRKDHQYWKNYQTATEANADLSWACVCYGRQRTGLPPLERRDLPCKS